MSDLMSTTADMLEVASRLGRLAADPSDPAAIESCRKDLGGAAGRLNTFAAGVLESGGAPDPGLLRAACAASRAAMSFTIATRMLGDLAAANGEQGETARRASAIVAHYAYLQAIAGTEAVAAQAAPPEAGVMVPTLPDGVAPVASTGVGAAPPADADLRVLRAVAGTHREHARYHGAYKLEQALELAREANRIKAIADVLLGGGGPAPISGVDYTDPRYRAAPCSDLNALQALPWVGILFLEGSGEPPEIATLKTRLDALGGEIGEMGTFLSRAMDAAWTREQPMLSPDFIDAAWQRLLVVIGNWRASHELVLAGRLTGIALGGLNAIDFTPQAVRASLHESGRRLRDAGWTLDMAAQCCARAGISLIDNDWRYTEYGEFLDERLAAAR